MGTDCKLGCPDKKVPLRVSNVCSGCLPQKYDGRVCYLKGVCETGNKVTNIWYDKVQNSMECKPEPCKIDVSETVVYCVDETRCPDYLFRYGDACIKTCPAGTRNTST